MVAKGFASAAGGRGVAMFYKGAGGKCSERISGGMGFYAQAPSAILGDLPRGLVFVLYYQHTVFHAGHCVEPRLPVAHGQCLHPFPAGVPGYSH